MEEEKKVPGATPGEGKKEEEKVAIPGVPQGRFDEIYGKWKSAEEEKALLQQEKDYYKSLQTTPKVETTKKEFDWESFQENPEAVIERKVEEKLRQRENLYVQQTSREKVKERHPDLFNPDGSPNIASPKFKVYDQVVSENPEYLTLKKGPEFAMREMEERLRVEEEKKSKVEEAEKLRLAKEEGKKEEQKRSAEVKGAFTTSATAPKEEEKKVELSESEKRIASRMGMTHEAYAEAKAKKGKNLIMR